MLGVLLLPSGFAWGQWVEESYSLKSGWNAIWLSQDCSYEKIDTLLEGEPRIMEVWRWNGSGSGSQFTESPQEPVPDDTAWQVWRRGKPGQTTLSRLLGNSSYLVRVKGANSLSLTLTGRPLPPKHVFTSDGMNLLGFPVHEEGSRQKVNFARFFSYSAILRDNPDIIAYNGGPLRWRAPKNPAPIGSPRLTQVERGRAYWVQAKNFVEYQGPLEVFVNSGGLDYGDGVETLRVRIRNVTDPAKNETVTASLQLAESASPPTGHPEIAGAVPLLERGRRDENLNYTYAPFSGSIERELAPGEETVVALTLDRSALGSAPGANFQSILQVRDSLDLTRIDLPVRAVSTSFEGLWVGDAVVTAVDETNTGGRDGEIAHTPVSDTFPIRLIMHQSATGGVRMLQQVYLGVVEGETVASVSERSDASQQIRISSSVFPVDMATRGNGNLGKRGAVDFEVDLGYNDHSNPFVHRYHPDHDNLDERHETTLPSGKESYDISRNLTFQFGDPPAGIDEPAWGSTTLGGEFSEVISGLRTEEIRVSGRFVMKKVSDVSTLITD